MAGWPEYQSESDQAKLRPLRSAGTRRPAAELAEVAEIYRQALQDGRPPTRAVAERFTISRDAVVEPLGDMRSGTLTDDRRTTLAVYLTRRLEKQQLARKRRTYDSYAEVCRLCRIPALGHVQLAGLREQHVLDAHRAMRKLNRPAELADRSEMLRRLASVRATVPHLPGTRVRTAPSSETTV
jgi:hypothetical protein